MSSNGSLPPPLPGAGSSMGMDPKVAGLACYAPCCIGLVASVVFVVAEKESRFVRFHAFQSLLVHGALIVLSIALGICIAVVGFVSSMLAGILSLLMNVVFGLGGLALVVFLMMKAYAGEEYSLPVVGEMARKFASQ